MQQPSCLGYKCADQGCPCHKSDGRTPSNDGPTTYLSEADVAELMKTRVSDVAAKAGL